MGQKRRFVIGHSSMVICHWGCCVAPHPAFGHLLPAGEVVGSGRLNCGEKTALGARQRKAELGHEGVGRSAMVDQWAYAHRSPGSSIEDSLEEPVGFRVVAE